MSRLERVMARVRAAGFPFQIQTCHTGGYAAVVGEYGSGYRPHEDPTDALLALAFDCDFVDLDTQPMIQHHARNPQ